MLALGELHKGEWKKKLSTKTDGMSITVSGPEGWVVGTDRSTTTYPLREALLVGKTQEALQLDELESDDESEILPVPKRARQ